MPPDIGVTSWSPHVFDDFTPTLTRRHRVYGMTRRGFGQSSAPDSGYDFDRLAADVMAVVDALGLEQPIIVGHSFAGEEIHVVGSRYSSEVAALIYIDAAFNRADEALFVLARERYERHAAWFRAFARSTSAVAGISGDHYLFITNPADVRAEVEAFASSLD